MRLESHPWLQKCSGNIFVLVKKNKGGSTEERNATYKVNTDGRDVTLGIGVVSESQEQTTLADTTVSDEKELEEIIAKTSTGRLVEWTTAIQG